MQKKATKILIVQLSSLGDLVTRFDSFAYLRNLHSDAHITLLTRYTYAEFMKHCPAFDSVMVDFHPYGLNFLGLLKINRRIVAGGFDYIYNLHGSSRSRRYLWMARGCEHLAPPTLPVDFVADKNWLGLADIASFALPEKYVALAIGCSAHQPEKRWSPANYGALCSEILSRGFLPVLIGSDSEINIAEKVRSFCPEALSLVNRTDLLQLTSVIANASYLVGNDTGAIHIADYIGRPSLVLISQSSKSYSEHWKKERMSILYKPDLSQLSVNEVIAHLPNIL